ncbi:MAG: tol-pal system-associated acyl-CoA thioesterase [Magnetococcales bacterium]|nr:tol-pal system-associated acyl-CoA thioesterase [Magnetococcales bacterium]MBF0151817.1 tol-pal system-associated acyl-CoA thioesterase [Magnetococcales bacterium]MBF0174584.1 tol-pal system-associated acyl-CoA thioesterase [Magnetococcales bacterium]MBF0346745.1 tol-pal system-associated acyl-CoA thioesterase [Magnetococcales bacterium]MBF0630372.1 tol-pal system-associated acyl-CoA thioesterase [Magnetococcales bacterium]
MTFQVNHDSFAWPIRVYYEDTDSGGVVYHSVYLNFMERARTEWLRSLGFDQSALARDRGLVFAVSRIQVHFLAPARMDDALLITLTLAKQGGASLHLHQQILHMPNRRPLVRAEVRIAMLNRAFKPVRFPPDLLQGKGREAAVGERVDSFTDFGSIRNKETAAHE